MTHCRYKNVLTFIFKEGAHEFTSPKLTTTGLFAYPNSDASTLLIACGDSDGNLNFWDTQNVKQSFPISEVGGIEPPSKSHLYK